MEGKKQIVKSTKAQRGKLTEFMSINRAFANGEFSGSRRMEEQWAALRDLLSVLGPDKSVGQGKQRICDLITTIYLESRIGCKKNTGLKVHCLTHDTSKNDEYYCPINKCALKNKPFHTYEAIKKHLDEHAKIKTLECVVCKKVYTSLAMLKSHTRSHTLDRPRRCMYCVNARAYVRGAQLVKHVRKAHPDAFKQHLVHVRRVMGSSEKIERVKQTELDSILNLLDAEADRIIEGYGGEGVLYGGMQEVSENELQTVETEVEVEGPLMGEEELVKSLGALLKHLVDPDELAAIAEPNECVDVVLERIIAQCGVKPADSSIWTRVQCLRENTKHLFQYVIEDKRLIQMLETHTVDQVIKHILKRANDDDADADADADADGDTEVEESYNRLTMPVAERSRARGRGRGR